MFKSIKNKYFDRRKTENKCEIHKSVILPCNTNISLGECIYIGPGTFIDPKGKVTIDDGAIISSNVTILSSSHVLDDCNILPYGPGYEYHTTKIGKGCWIGINAILLPGIELGDGVIVGAGSVVTKSFSSGSIIAGNPAKLLKKRDINGDVLTKKSYLLNINRKSLRRA